MTLCTRGWCSAGAVIMVMACTASPGGSGGGAASSSSTSSSSSSSSSTSSSSSSSGGGVDGGAGSSGSSSSSSSSSGGSMDAGMPGLDCTEPPVPGATLAVMAERFATEVYPHVDDPVVGCRECHGANTSRRMTLGATGEETFHRMRAAGVLGRGPGSALFRVLAQTMPPEGPYWNDNQVADLRRFACDLEAFEERGTLPADEAFPEELRAPYTGPAPTAYDNTFITFEQLRGRLRTQFEDAYLAVGMDALNQDIALLGGVDFIRTYVPSRQATPEFLLALDHVADEVCTRAATDKSGPFAGVDTQAPTREETPSSTRRFEAEDMDARFTNGMVIPPQGPWGDTPRHINMYTNGYASMALTLPSPGVYRVRIRAQGDEAGPDLPRARIQLGETPLGNIDVPEPPGWATYAVEGMAPGGAATLQVQFVNDYYDELADPAVRDRNLLLDWVELEGPLPGTTPGAAGAEAETRNRIAQVFERVLLRAPVRSPAEADEVQPLYALLRELEDFDGNRVLAWSGVCQGLVKHPDFLFTRPPRFDTAPAADRPRLLLIKKTLDLLHRPPTEEEFNLLNAGATTADLLERWVESAEFKDAYFHRLRLALESDGTPAGDEPARTWAWMMLNQRPIAELLTGTYRVDANFQQRPRDAVHGPTGVLTMPGYLRHKPGLPHYNYAARVLSDFLGYVFEVPPSIVDSRAGSTAASTVDPQSVCFSCHQLLTPLAHQRLRWKDDGTYRDVDENGVPIDDSDRDLVQGYPYPGHGMASFAAQAVRKERFIRRMANANFEMLFSRPMRHLEDERALYQALYEAADGGRGTFRDLLLVVLDSPSYTQPVGSRGTTGSVP